MPKEVIKTAFGGYKEVQAGGDFVLISYDQYFNFKNLEHNLKLITQKADEWESKYHALDREFKSEKVKIELNSRSEKAKIIREADEKTEKQQEKFQKKIVELEKKIENQKKSSENLLRINRERSNSDRNLTPKKERSGYILLVQKEHAKKIVGKYGHSSVKLIWTLTFQSPYPVEMEPESVGDLICEYMGGAFKAFYDLTADYNAGYWTFKIDSLRFSKPLDDWLPPKKQKK